MDQKPSLRPMSFVVEMEDDKCARDVLPEPIPLPIMERNKPPPTDQVKHADSATGSNDPKLDIAERRALPAQLRSSTTEVDTRLLRTYEKFIGSPEHLKNSQISADASLEAAENGESLYAHVQEHVDVSGEGMRPENTPTTSTDSEKVISMKGDKASTMTNTSRTSDESKNVKKKDHNAKSYGTDSTTVESEEASVITKAWYAFEKSWEVQVELTPQENLNGYRFSKNIDPAYLGFYPRESDKRKFLKAYPIIEHVPEAKLGCNCALPMTLCQWSFIMGFFVVFGALGAGVYFYLRTRN